MDDDENLCRFCFEGEEEATLISPCACKGDQKCARTLKCIASLLRALPTEPRLPHGGAPLVSSFGRRCAPGVPQAVAANRAGVAADAPGIL